MAHDGQQRPETLQDLLDAHHIVLGEAPRPNFNHGGARSKLVCPACGGGRTREKNFYVYIDPDMKGATWHCLRANNCGIEGGGRIADATRIVQRPPKVYRTPEPVARPDLPDSLIAYYAEFGISEDTLRSLGIYRTTRRMPVIDADGKEVKGDHGRLTASRPVIAFPYVDQGVLLNVKYKAVYHRGEVTLKRFSQELDPRPSVFNIDSFTDPEGTGMMVEGEDDVAACWEAGWRQVGTLANGSPAKVSETYDPATDTDDRYVALRGDPRLETLSKVILAGDMDAAGMRHREEMARRFGKWRCWNVTWPEGCNDAKATLKKLGPEAVLAAIEACTPYPLEGVDPIDEQAVLDLQAGITGEKYVTGYKAFDDRVTLSGLGQLIITTGVPGHGKSALWNFLAVAYAERWEEEVKDNPKKPIFHSVVFSGETPVARVSLDLMAMHAQRPAFPHAIVPHIAPEEISQHYLPWVRRHFSFITWPDASTEPPVSWVLQRVRDLVKARGKGCKLVILDPWQEFDDEMPDSERNPSKWIGKVLGRIRAMAFELGINIVLIAHPTKRKRVDGKFQMPVGDDIADSRFFYTKCHVGLTVHRPDLSTDGLLVHTWKSKDMLYGMTGESVCRFDKITRRIWPAPVAVDPVDNAFRHWQDDAG